MLKRLEEMPDEHIDTTDIPEIRDWDGWVPVSQLPGIIQKLKELEAARRNNGRHKSAKRITREDALRIQNEIMEANRCKTRERPHPSKK